MEAGPMRMKVPLADVIGIEDGCEAGAHRAGWREDAALAA